MLNVDNRIQSKVKNLIISNFIILLIFLFWFSYSTFSFVFNLYIFSLSILAINLFFLTIKYKKGKEIELFSSYAMLIIVLIFFLFNSLLSLISDFTPFLFSFYNLLGLKHKFNFLVFSILLALVLTKLFSIFLYFNNNPKILELGKGDEIFQYFTKDLSEKKKLYLPILFPLSALIEELVYRSLILSFLMFYFNIDSFLGIIFVSIIFGTVHLSTSKNWGHVVSTLLSSIIYSIALIQLGLLYSWGFHLTTNIFVLLFYYRTRRKNETLII